MAELSVVGKSVRRVDALEKVTGKAKFCSDFKTPGMLYAKLLRSPYPHAKIVYIDTSKAVGLPGVKAVITGKDVPPVRIGAVFWDEYILPYDNIVRAIGQPVAAVAALTKEVAEEALDLIDVEYEELPAVFDVEEATKEDPPAILHPDLAQYLSPMPFLKARPEPGRPNIFNHFKIRNGDVERGFQEAELIVENRFSTARIQHCQLETHRCDAWWEPDGTLVLRISSQGLWYDASALRLIFNLSPSKIRVLSSYEGGGFGGKIFTLTGPIAALLALKSGKPVRLEYTREEHFVDGRHRPQIITNIRDGVKKDGTIVAREMTISLDMGRHSSTTAIVSKNCAFGAVGTYRIPNFKLDTYGAYTNNPITGPYRGLGTPEVTWAIEQQMDILAERLGISAIEIRKRNILKEGDRDVCGQVTHSIGVEECLTKVAEWGGRNNKTEEQYPWKQGKGIAIGNKYTLAGTHSVVYVKVYPDARVEVRHGLHEIGQGLNTVLAQIVAEEFQVPVDWVKVTHGDTTLVGYDFCVCSSRATFHTGNATIKACQDAKRQIFETVSAKLGVNPEDLAIRAGEVYVPNWSGKSIKISELFTPEGLVVEKGEILGRGHFYGPIILEDPETGQSERMVTYYAHGACAVEVAVNVETGEVKVLRIAQCYDMGTPINPKMVEAQIEGGTVQGIGSAIYEEIVLERGMVVNPNFMDYKMPTAAEAPSSKNMKALIAAIPHREGPFGAKGLGEATMVPVAPAIANAVYNAVGIRIKDLPISREKIMRALDKIG